MRLQGKNLGEKAHKVKYNGIHIKDRPDRQKKLGEIGFTFSNRFRSAATSSVTAEQKNSPV